MEVQRLEGQEGYEYKLVDKLILLLGKFVQMHVRAGFSREPIKFC